MSLENENSASCPIDCPLALACRAMRRLEGGTESSLSLQGGVAFELQMIETSPQLIGLIARGGKTGAELRVSGSVCRRVSLGRVEPPPEAFDLRERVRAIVRLPLGSGLKGCRESLALSEDASQCLVAALTCGAGAGQLGVAIGKSFLECAEVTFEERRVPLEGGVQVGDRLACGFDLCDLTLALGKPCHEGAPFVADVSESCAGGIALGAGVSYPGVGRGGDRFDPGVRRLGELEPERVGGGQASGTRFR